MLGVALISQVGIVSFLLRKVQIVDNHMGVFDHFALVDTVHCIEFVLTFGLGVGFPLLETLPFLFVDEHDAAKDHHEADDGGQGHDQSYTRSLIMHSSQR